MESYKPIKFEDNDRLRFIKNGSDNRECSFCGKGINRDETILAINYQFWLHLGCIDPCCEGMDLIHKLKNHPQTVHKIISLKQLNHGGKFKK